ncbi:MAG: TadE/TadG family type IV pilus assembly protein [Methylocella sp.]
MKRFFLLKKRAGFRLGNRGVAAVEFALIGPPLILLLFGTIQCGRMLWTQNSLQYAVELAARCAVLSQATTPCGGACCTTSQIQSYAASQAYSLNLSPSIFSVPSPPSCGTGTQVSASLPYTTGAPVSITVTLTATSCRPS